MFKKTMMTVALVWLAQAVHAEDGAFSCEQIKDKKVRSACVTSRSKQAPVKSMSAEETRLAAFVAEAKTELTRRFNDPQSAQFSNLFVTTGMDSKFLCGSVNAKNLYGAYVGFKTFYVWKKDDASNPSVTWISGDGPPQLERASLGMAETFCSFPSVSVK